MVSEETKIDGIRVYLHLLQEMFGRKAVLEGIKQWKQQKPRIVAEPFTIPTFLTKPKRKKKK